MKFNLIDYACIALLYFIKLFKEKKHLHFIYKKIITLIEARYLKTNRNSNGFSEKNYKEKLKKLKICKKQKDI